MNEPKYFSEQSDQAPDCVWQLVLLLKMLDATHKKFCFAGHVHALL